MDGMGIVMIGLSLVFSKAISEIAYLPSFAWALVEGLRSVAVDIRMQTKGRVRHKTRNGMSETMETSCPKAPMETPDPPSHTPGASKQVVLAPHDIPRILTVGVFC